MANIDLNLYARPQKRIRINRRRWINLLDLGEGGPTVVLCGGDHSTTLIWARVQTELATFASSPMIGPGSASAIWDHSLARHDGSSAIYARR